MKHEALYFIESTGSTNCLTFSTKMECLSIPILSLSTLNHGFNVRGAILWPLGDLSFGILSILYQGA